MQVLALSITEFQDLVQGHTEYKRLIRNYSVIAYRVLNSISTFCLTNFHDGGDLSFPK